MAIVCPDPSPPVAPMLWATLLNPYALRTCVGVYPASTGPEIAPIVAGLAITVVERRRRDSSASSAHHSACRPAAQGEGFLAPRIAIFSSRVSSYVRLGFWKLAHPKTRVASDPANQNPLYLIIEKTGRGPSTKS